MRPLAVFSGIVMASAGAIALGLVVVVVIYLIVGDDAPQVQREIPVLWANAGIFTGFSLVSVAAFYAQVTHKAWWAAAVAAQVGALALLVLYYWP
jgi:hypothetical protein